MKIIVGLGNPGTQYQKNRHNTGYMALEWLAEKQDASWHKKSKPKADIAQMTIDNQPLLLVKPSDFYNNSGDSVRKVQAFYNVELKDILVIHDELALPFGCLRVRQKGSDAGNNGVKNIIEHIGADFARIRVGINRDGRRQPDMSYVLSDFNKTETAKLPAIFEQCQKIILDFANDRLNSTSFTV